MTLKSICITNNKLWLDSVHASKPNFVMIEGNPERVFLEARDHIHKGWRFVNHPLYGNFHPATMPYRTLLLVAGKENEGMIDLYSVDLLEKALGLFRERTADRPQPSKDIANDYAILDRELMKETLEKYYSGGMS